MKRSDSLLLLPFRPLLASLRDVSPRALRGDLIAGLTVAVIAVPQSMAYALIAGVPAEYGLYTVIFQSIIGSLFNSQRFLSVGPINTQSLLVASIVTHVMRNHGDLSPQDYNAMYLQLVVGLTLLKGLLQLGLAVARLGAMVRYVSSAVIVGFTAGAGVLIAVGQIGNFLGIPTGSGDGAWPGILGIVMGLWPHVTQISTPSLILGLAALGIVIGAQMISKLLPGPLLAVVVTATVVALAGWTEQDLMVVGQLPTGLPGLSMPWAGLAHWETLMSGALALSLLGLMEAYAIGKSIAAKTGGRISANQELFSQGLTNFVTSFLSCIPGSGSFSRSALNHYAGARTCFAGVFNGLFVAAIFLLLAGYARYVPLTALAAILFVIAYSLIDWRYFRQVWRSNRADAIVCFTTFIATLVVPLQYAVFVGIFLNLTLYLRRASQLHMAQMVRTPGGPFVERPITDRQGNEQVMFLQMEGDLFFGVADELQDRLADITASPTRVVIFRLKRTHSIDSTVLGVFAQFVRTMQSMGRHVVLCGVRPELLETMRRFGLVSLIGKENVFETRFGVFTSAKAALLRARELLQASIDTTGIEDADETEAWAYEI